MIKALVGVGLLIAGGWFGIICWKCLVLISVVMFIMGNKK